MILANYTQENRNCYRVFGQAFTNPLAALRPQVTMRFYTPDTVLTGLDQSGFPHGYNTEAAWQLPIKTGGLGATQGVRGAGSLAADALAVKLALADLTGSGDITDALGSLIVQALASLTGSGGITDANLQAFLQAIADLTGSGGVSSAALTGAGAMSGALTGSGAATAILTAIGELIAELTVTGTGLSTANVGEAVWSALATANNSPGTMGEKLNDAGSAGNPWATDLSGSQTAGTAGYMLKVIQQILRNKQITDPTTGVMTVYDDDGTTVLFEANLKEDAAGTQDYRGQGAERRERLE